MKNFKVFLIAIVLIFVGSTFQEANAWIIVPPSSPTLDPNKVTIEYTIWNTDDMEDYNFIFYSLNNGNYKVLREGLIYPASSNDYIIVGTEITKYNMLGGINLTFKLKESGKICTGFILGAGRYQVKIFINDGIPTMRVARIFGN